MTTHRAYAGQTVEQLVAEIKRLGLDLDSTFQQVLIANPRRTGRWCAVEVLVAYALRCQAQQDYLDLTDEFNDAPAAELGLSLDDDFDPEAVARAAAYAADHGYAWPPQVGDFDRACYTIAILPRPLAVVIR